MNSSLQLKGLKTVTKQDSLDLTVCLLNWKRPDNLNKIIDNLYGKVKIFLWDNSGIFKKDSRIDWQITSSINKGCHPRWWMALFAQTEFVCSYDDDFMFKDVSILQEAIDVLKSNTEKKAVGFCGRLLEDTSCDYKHTKTFEVNKVTDKLQNKKEIVDLLLGRFILTTTQNIQKIKLSYTHTQDDIQVCAQLADKQRQKFVLLKSLAESVIELPDNHALWKRPGHFNLRQEALIKYWYNDTSV